MYIIAPILVLSVIATKCHYTTLPICFDPQETLKDGKPVDMYMYMRVL